MTRLAALVLLVVTACAPRTVDAPGFHDATGELGVYLIEANIILLDLAAVAALEAQYPGAAAWIDKHEYAHWRTIGSGITLGPGLVGLERLAQCGAELLLGVPPPFPMPVERGYWDCPPWALERVRPVFG